VLTNVSTKTKPHPCLLAIELIDILAVAETWLSPANDFDLLDDGCSCGFSALHVPFGCNRRGGGVVALFRSSIQIIQLTLLLARQRSFQDLFRFSHPYLGSS